MEVKQLLPEEWAEFSEQAHLVGFKENRPASMDRIDYALLATTNEKIVGWLTARELDSETVYWQFGAGVPDAQSSMKAVEAYRSLIDYTFKRYKRISTLVENNNVRYLKLAMHFGFRIIGTRLFKNQVYVELLNERESDERI